MLWKNQYIRSIIARKMGNTPYMISLMKYEGVSYPIDRHSTLNGS